MARLLPHIHRTRRPLLKITRTFKQLFARLESPWLRRAAVVLLAVVLVVQWARIIEKPRGDYVRHYEFARRMLAGDNLYAGGLHIPYPPFWAMAHTPVTVLPMHTSQIVLYPFMVGVAVLLFAVLIRLLPPTPGRARHATFAVVALTLLMTSRYWLRDTMEVLANTGLLALAWLAILCWRQRRDTLGGALLGLAIAMKCTAGLFVPYFLLKRQWRMAGSTIAFTGLFTLAPILIQGPRDYRNHMTQWTNNIRAGMTQPDPTRGVLGEDRHQNMSLRVTLARYLTHLPADHLGRPDHPASVDVLTLPKTTTRWIIAGVTAALLASVAWRFRRPVSQRDEPHLLWELAAVSILMLLLSPITWGQHCVAVIPAWYLIERAWIAGHKLRPWMWCVVIFWIVAVLVLNRAVVGTTISHVLQSYHIETFALIGLLLVTMLWRPSTVQTPNPIHGSPMN